MTFNLLKILVTFQRKSFKTDSELMQVDKSRLMWKVPAKPGTWKTIPKKQFWRYVRDILLCVSNLARPDQLKSLVNNVAFLS